MKRYLEFKNNIKIYFEIILKEPLNIKQSKEDKNQKSSIKYLRYAEDKGEVYIPGSSLRGMFNKEYDKISKNINYFPKINDLFGSLERKSRIHFEDAFLENIDLRKQMNEKIRPNKDITSEIHAFTPMKFSKHYFEDSNDTKINSKNNVLTIETIKKEFKLRSVIEIKNINYRELYILIYIFKLSYESKLKIGSNKLRGLGLINLNILNIELENYDGYYLNKDIERYFEIDETKSLKLNEKYLRKILKLKKEFLNFNFENKEIKNNEFLKFIQKMEDKNENKF